jgi:hypothetical protein
MSYKDIELDEEDDSFIPAAQRPLEEFKITHWQALQFLQKQVNTYKQFKKFPRTHKSFKSLQYTGAMYEFILDSLSKANNP